MAPPDSATGRGRSSRVLPGIADLDRAISPTRNRTFPQSGGFAYNFPMTTATASTRFTLKELARLHESGRSLARDAFGRHCDPARTDQRP